MVLAVRARGACFPQKYMQKSVLFGNVKNTTVTSFQSHGQSISILLLYLIYRPLSIKK